MDFNQFLKELKRRNVLRVVTAYPIAGWLVIQLNKTISVTLKPLNKVHALNSLRFMAFAQKNIFWSSKILKKKDSKLKIITKLLSLRVDTRSLNSFKKDNQFLEVSPSFDMTRIF